MKKTAAGVLIVLLISVDLLADTPAAPFSYVTASWSGMCYFEMIPPVWSTTKSSFLDSGHGIAYRLLRDGSQKELWRTDGWYSIRVFLAEGGTFLVRLEPVKEGQRCSHDDLALAFYKDGLLMRQYSTADLVKNSEKIVRTVSHFYWLASDTQRLEGERVGGRDIDADAEPKLFLNNTFRIKTCDGLVYVFDVTSGNLK